jgi:hypothetical protein
MTTTEAIKFCFTDETYRVTKNHLSPPELLKTACLIAFRREWDKWPTTSEHYQVAARLRRAYNLLTDKGIFSEIDEVEEIKDVC